MSFFPFLFLSSFFELRERECVIAVLSFLTGSFGEYFLFYGLAEFYIYIYVYIYIALAWRHRYCLSKILSDPPPDGDFGGSFNISYHFNYCPANPGSGFSPGVWHEIRPIYSLRHLSSKLIFFSSFNGRPKFTYIPYFSFNGQSLAAS